MFLSKITVCVLFLSPMVPVQLHRSFVLEGIQLKQAFTGDKADPALADIYGDTALDVAKEDAARAADCEVAEARAGLGALSAIWTDPVVLKRLREALGDGSSPADVASIISEDVGLTSKLLQLTGSSFFFRSERTGDLEVAVSRLGTKMLEHVFGPDGPLTDLALRGPVPHEIQRVAEARTEFATALVDVEDVALTKVMVRLLDLGHLALLTANPDLDITVSAADVESRTGVSCEQAAALIGRFWGIPDRVLCPEPPGDGPLRPWHAAALARQLLGPYSSWPDTTDLEHDPRWGRWVQLARGVAREFGVTCPAGSPAL